MQTRESAISRFLYVQNKIMNKCWTLMPPRETTETTGTDLIMQRSSQARDIANGDMKKDKLQILIVTINITSNFAFIATPRSYLERGVWKDYHSAMLINHFRPFPRSNKYLPVPLPVAILIPPV